MPAHGPWPWPGLPFTESERAHAASTQQIIASLWRENETSRAAGARHCHGAITATGRGQSLLGDGHVRGTASRKASACPARPARGAAVQRQAKPQIPGHEAAVQQGPQPPCVQCASSQRSAKQTHLAFGQASEAAAAAAPAAPKRRLWERPLRVIYTQFNE